MKLSEAIARLEENSKLKFESYSEGGYSTDRMVLSSSNGYFIICRYSSDGKLISPSFGRGGFSGNVLISDDWQQIAEPVDFMTAINSGKNIKPKTMSGFQSAGYWFRRFCDTQVDDVYYNRHKYINGKWEIEP